MKRIVFTASDNGVDGREPTRILYASFDEEERDTLLSADKSKQWRTKGEQIVDVDVARKLALSKLNGIDRLVLGLSPWPNEA